MSIACLRKALSTIAKRTYGDGAAAVLWPLFATSFRVVVDGAGFLCGEMAAAVMVVENCGGEDRIEGCRLFKAQRVLRALRGRNIVLEKEVVEDESGPGWQEKRSACYIDEN